MALRSRRTGSVVAHAVQPAFDSETRRKGLLGRDSLPGGHAIVLAPCNAVHTFFMRFSIDVVFVRRSGEIVRIAHGVPPWRIAMAFAAHAVVELPAGAARTAGIGPGDVLELAELDD